MKLWIGGEICADVAESFRKARIAVEETINATISVNDYALDLDAWDVIAIIRDDEAFPERSKYSLKKRDMDFRLCVDYSRFKVANDRERESMIVAILIRSLEILRRKSPTTEGIDKLKADVESIANRMGWK